MNIIEISRTFQTDEQCLEFLEKMRWPDGKVRCVTCGGDRISKITRKTPSKNLRSNLYMCLEPTCKQQFTSTSGTIFHRSHLSLVKWFNAVALVINAKKGISALQLGRTLGIIPTGGEKKKGRKTAWFLAHRIRKAMEDAEGSQLTGIVEVDETYVGGKTIRRKDRGLHKPKDAVVGMIERGGRVRFRHVRKGSVKAKDITALAEEHISPDVDFIVTDESAIYPFGLPAYQRFKHLTIMHKQAYVKNDIHTNTVESAFSLLKRGIMGSFHQVSIRHLKRYLAEFEYRFNNRKDEKLFVNTIARMCQTGKLPYKQLTSAV